MSTPHEAIASSTEWDRGAAEIRRLQAEWKTIGPVRRTKSEALWQRFRRGRGAHGTGSGLGLAIVADIARLHGASATLAPGQPGRGLRVQLRFAPSVT